MMYFIILSSWCIFSADAESWVQLVDIIEIKLSIFFKKSLSRQACLLPQLASSLTWSVSLIRLWFTAEKFLLLNAKSGKQNNVLSLSNPLSVLSCNYKSEILHIHLVSRCLCRTFSICVRNVKHSSLACGSARCGASLLQAALKSHQRRQKAGRRGVKPNGFPPFIMFPVGSFPGVCAHQIQQFRETLCLVCGLCFAFSPTVSACEHGRRRWSAPRPWELSPLCPHRGVERRPHCERNK